MCTLSLASKSTDCALLVCRLCTSLANCRSPYTACSKQQTAKVRLNGERKIEKERHLLAICRPLWGIASRGREEQKAESRKQESDLHFDSHSVHWLLFLFPFFPFLLYSPHLSLYCGALLGLCSERAKERNRHSALIVMKMAILWSAFRQSIKNVSREQRVETKPKCGIE